MRFHSTQVAITVEREMVGTATAPRHGKPSPEAEAARRQALALVGVQYKNWDVVWARMAGFPWWPGVVFHGWDAVAAAGLPLPRERPALALPEKREVAVMSAKGKLEQRTVTDRFCLVMFLDKGNWCAVNMNTQVTPFTLGFRANSKPNKKAKTSGFRLAVQRAIRLLHTVRLCTIQELVVGGVRDADDTLYSLVHAVCRRTSARKRTLRC